MTHIRDEKIIKKEPAPKNNSIWSSFNVLGWNSKNNVEEIDSKLSSIREKKKVLESKVEEFTKFNNRIFDDYVSENNILLPERKLNSVYN